MLRVVKVRLREHLHKGVVSIDEVGAGCVGDVLLALAQRLHGHAHSLAAIQRLRQRVLEEGLVCLVLVVLHGDHTQIRLDFDGLTLRWGLRWRLRKFGTILTQLLVEELLLVGLGW